MNLYVHKSSYFLPQNDHTWSLHLILWCMFLVSQTLTSYRRVVDGDTTNIQSSFNASCSPSSTTLWTASIFASLYGWRHLHHFCLNILYLVVFDSGSQFVCPIHSSHWLHTIPLIHSCGDAPGNTAKHQRREKTALASEFHFSNKGRRCQFSRSFVSFQSG